LFYARQESEEEDDDEVYEAFYQTENISVPLTSL